MACRELIVDSFAGGGGASLGITWATGRHPDVAVNHNPAAIAMHAANHPKTRHFTEDVFKVNPRTATKGKPVGLLWASPDCKHFSRAKGSKPVSKNIRGLAWVVVKWAVECSPRVIILENVREFADWGPLLPRWACPCGWKGTEGQVTLARRGRPRCPRCEGPKVCITEQLVPDPAKKGLTFRKFTGRLRNLGYDVKWKVLNAADYGAPTHRRRLFLVARRDGLPITWPEPTHGDPKRIAVPSLFAPLKPWRTAAECIDWTLPVPSIFDRKKPLAEKTLKRIAAGIKRYVLDNPKPFLVTVNHGRDEFRGRAVDVPLPTVTASRSEALVIPLLTPVRTHGGGGNDATPANVPLRTITATKRGEFAVIAPTLLRHFGKSSSADAAAPHGTVMPGGAGKSALVAAFLAKHYGGVVGVAADTPLPTTTARGTQTQIVAANLVHLNHGEKQWNGVDEPARTVTTGNHAALVYSFLTKYFGTGCGQRVSDPAHTVTGKDRFGLVTVALEGEPYVITDIGMRMLKPRELARAQGFPDEYILTGNATNQVERIGNSVCPAVARALVEANYVFTPVGV